MKEFENSWVARLEEGTGIDVVERNTGFGIVWLGTELELNDCGYPIEKAKNVAKLIAAAPELLESLSELVEWLKMGDYDKSFLEKAENAIKKATE